MDINQYRPQQVSYNELKNQVEIPEFKRGLVWSDKQKADFIDSLSKGYPFGSLLLFDDWKRSKRYQLVDGLQRYATVRDYEANRYNYIDFNTVFSEDLEALFGFINSTIRTLTQEERSGIITAFKLCLATHIGEATPIFETADALFKCVEFLKANEQSVTRAIRPIIEKMIYKSLEYIPLDRLYLPAVMYKGDASDLPEVYRRINSTGAQL